MGGISMEKVIYTNSRGESVELGGEAPFILTKIEGTGAVNLNMQTQKSPYQDGVSYLNSTLDPRDLSIEVTILADNLNQMITFRKELIKTFNPKLGKGSLIYKLGNIEREITAIPELAPVFPDAGDFKEVMQKGLIQLFCPAPLWIDPQIEENEIITWVGGMVFPLTFPTAFSTAGDKIKNIINTGDVETPVKLEIYGKATNPKILLRETGEFIKINKHILSGEVLTVTTEFGNKRVELDGVNAFNYIDTSSTFFNLEIGDNVIELITDVSNDNASIKITYRNRYLGV